MLITEETQSVKSVHCFHCSESRGPHLLWSFFELDSMNRHPFSLYGKEHTNTFCISL